MLKLLLLMLFLLGIASCAVLPVEKCNLEDSSCLIPAFQKAVPIFMVGMPEYSVEVLDVMEMDEVNFELAGLKFGLKDGRLKGLKNSVIDNVKWDLKKKKIEITYHFDASIKGHYTASGRILVLPITGDGQMKLKLKNSQIIIEVNYETEKTDGKDYIIPKSFSYKYDVKDGANFNLTNLFNGNKELSDSMLVFLNENWKEITKEFGGPIIEVAAKRFLKALSAFCPKCQLLTLHKFNVSLLFVINLC